MNAEERRAELLALIRAAPSPTRSQHRIRSLFAAAVALTIMVGLFFLMGGLRRGGHLAEHVTVSRPSELILVTFFGAAVVVAIAMWTLFGRGRSMLGRSRAWIAAFSVLTVGSLFGWKVLASTRFAEMTLPWPARPGFYCLGVSIALGVWPLAALCLARLRSDAVHPRVTGAALGVVAGACTWLFVDLWCPVAYPPHLLLGHVLPILLFALVGVGLGRRWIALARS